MADGPDWVGKARSKRCDLGILNRADGSARFQQGATSVLAAVYGPVEVKQSKEKADRTVVEVTVKSATGISGVRERTAEDTIRATCQEVILTKLYPHSSVEITLQVETDDGSLLSCLWNASCMALVDAGVGMDGLFTGVTFRWDDNGVMLVDPTSAQEGDSKGVVHLAVHCQSQEVITTYTHGEFSLQQLQESISVAKSMSSSNLDFYRQCVERKLSKEMLSTKTTPSSPQLH